MCWIFKTQCCSFLKLVKQPSRRRQFWCNFPVPCFSISADALSLRWKSSMCPQNQPESLSPLHPFMSQSRCKMMVIGLTNRMRECSSKCIKGWKRNLNLTRCIKTFGIVICFYLLFLIIFLLVTLRFIVRESHVDNPAYLVNFAM